MTEERTLRPEREIAVNPFVWNREITRAYIGKRSDSAFDRWCARYRVTPSGRGRYSKHRLDLGLQRESRA